VATRTAVPESTIWIILGVRQLEARATLIISTQFRTFHWIFIMVYPCPLYKFCVVIPIAGITVETLEKINAVSNVYFWMRFCICTLEHQGANLAIQKGAFDTCIQLQKELITQQFAIQVLML